VRPFVPRSFGINQRFVQREQAHAKRSDLRHGKG
jgi:hypothetical protein